MKSQRQSKLITPALVLVAVIVTYGLTTLTRSPSASNAPPVSPSVALAFPAAATGPALRGPWAIDPFGAERAMLGFPGMGQDAAAAVVRQSRALTSASSGDVPALDTLAATLLRGVDLGAGLANLGRADAVTARALALQPDDYRATVYRSWVRLAQHRYAEAATLAAQAIRAQPDAAANYGVLGEAAYGLGQYDRAAAAFQKLTDMQPGLVAYTWDALLRRAVGDQHGAIQLLRKALTAGDPRPAVVAWCVTQVADASFDDSGLLGAEIEYQAALRHDPRAAQALAGLARVRFAQRRPAEAIALYRRAIAQAPLPQFMAELAEVYAAAGQPAPAQASLQQARLAYQRQAAQGVEVALDRAYFEADHGRSVATAVAIAHRALAASQEAGIQDRAAWVLYQAGRYQEAWTTEEQALHHGVKSALGFFHAGMIVAQLHDPVSGFDYLREAVMINPHFSIEYANTVFAEMRRLAARP